MLVDGGNIQILTINTDFDYMVSYEISILENSTNNYTISYTMPDDYSDFSRERLAYVDDNDCKINEFYQSPVSIWSGKCKECCPTCARCDENAYNCTKCHPFASYVSEENEHSCKCIDGFEYHPKLGCIYSEQCLDGFFDNSGTCV
jgi:hypothetical protein